MINKNKVVISSGRDHHTLDRWFSHLPVDLAAEHGVLLQRKGIYGMKMFRPIIGMRKLFLFYNHSLIKPHTPD